MVSRSSSLVGWAAAVITIFSMAMLSACVPVSSSAVQPTSIPLPTNTFPPLQCDPVPVNSGSGVTMFRLPDNSEVYLSENTEIEITIAGYCEGITENSINLISGQVAIHTDLPEGSWFNVISPEGFIARLNATGAVEYDPSSGEFLLDCTNGTCTLGPNAQQFTQFSCNEGAGLSQNTTFPAPLAIDVINLQAKYGDWIVPNCLATETPTPSETPNPNETPSPGSNSNLAKTATAACATFHGKFPGTPCP
jgi:hypothetical protein